MPSKTIAKLSDNPTKLTMFQFEVLCGEYLIDPAIALENEKIVAALKNSRPTAEIQNLMETEF